MMTVRFDERSGILCSTSIGFTGGSDLDVYYEELEKLAAKTRARHGAVLHLVDAREAMVMSKDDAARLQQINEKRHRKGDRTAILSLSVMSKMQTSRFDMNNDKRMFVSEEEAIAWLLLPS